MWASVTAEKPIINANFFKRKKRQQEPSWHFCHPCPVSKQRATVGANWPSDEGLPESNPRHAVLQGCPHLFQPPLGGAQCNELAADSTHSCEPLHLPLGGPISQIVPKPQDPAAHG